MSATGDGELKSFESIKSNHETLESVTEALQRAGFEACEIIVGVDFTKSNQWTGKDSFEGRCLHDVTGTPNPYMQALDFMAKMLHGYDDDRSIPCYGFGDVATGKNSVFSFFPGNKPASGLEALVERYKEIASIVDMSGPTTFAPLIRQAMRDVERSGMKYHVLVVLADGQISMDCLEDTTRAIVDATRFPMSIIMIGVGDGPWDEMQNFDDKVPERGWDNFQFIEFTSIVQDRATANSEDRKHENFALQALMELPKQYGYAKKLTEPNPGPEVQRILSSIAPDVCIDPPPYN